MLQNFFICIEYTSTTLYKYKDSGKDAIKLFYSINFGLISKDSLSYW